MNEKLFNKCAFQEPIISIPPVPQKLPLELDEKIQEAKYNYKRRSSDIEFSEFTANLGQISEEHVKNSLAKSERSVIEDLKSSKNVQIIKDQVTGSPIIKIKIQIFERMSTEIETFVKNLLFYQIPILTNVIAIMLFYFEYYVDMTSLITFYDAGIYSKSTGFTFAPFMFGIFVISAFVLILAYVINVCIVATTLPVEGKMKKLIFSIFYPLILPLSQAILLIKEYMSKEPWTFARYTRYAAILDNYKLKIANLNVIRTVIENILQLLLAFFLIISFPLRTEVVSSGSPELLVLFIAKNLVSWMVKSWSLTTYYSILKNTNVGFLGKLVYCLSLFCTLSSRLLSIAFCLLFSSVFPDLPFIFYTLSNQPTYQQTAISPLAIDSLYQAHVSLAPAIAVPIILLSIPLLLCFITFYAEPMLEEGHSRTDLFFAACINIFCPFFPPIKFRNNHSRNKRLSLFILYSVFFITNIFLLLFPIVLYGSQFFSLILPIIDELIRFYSFRPTVKLPPSFPLYLPSWYLYGNKIFPLASVLSFILGVALFVFYSKKFHPWTPLPKKTIDAFKQQMSGE